MFAAFVPVVVLGSIGQGWYHRDWTDFLVFGVLGVGAAVATAWIVLLCPGGAVWVTDHVLVAENAFRRLDWIPWSEITAIDVTRDRGIDRITVTARDRRPVRLTAPSSGWLVVDEGLHDVHTRLVAVWQGAAGSG